MKILIIRFSSLGDIILTEPVSYILHRNFPEAQIDYLTKKQFIPLVENFRHINNIYHKKNKELFKINYDIIIDLHSKLSSYIVSFKLKGYRKIHYNKKHLKRVLIVKKIINSKIESTVNLYLSSLKKLHLHNEFEKPVLIPEKNQKIDNLLKSVKTNKTKVAIFAGAKHNTKMYPIEYLNQFIRLNKSKFQFILLGAPNEKELSATISKNNSGILDFTGEFDLSELIYFISQINIVISNDSGPMHIAAALNKPQIAIFGSTHPNLGFAPVNHKAIILQKNLPCRPCDLHGKKKCPLKHFRCMKDISPYELSKALISLQERYL